MRTYENNFCFLLLVQTKQCCAIYFGLYLIVVQTAVSYADALSFFHQFAKNVHKGSPYFCCPATLLLILSFLY